MAVASDKHTQRAGRASDTDLILAIAVTFAGLAFVAVPQLSGSILRSGIEAAILLFVPGYSLVAAIYSRKGDLTGFERIALSFGLSIAIVPLIGFGLAYSSWGLTVLSVALSTFLFVLATTLIAYLRRHALPPQARFSLGLETIPPLAALRPRIEDKAPLGLVILLTVSVLFSAAAIAYSLTTPEPRENYTELYLLGSSGTMQGYPTNFTLGQAKPVIVGIANHENQDVNYTLVVQLNDTRNKTTLYSGYQVVANGQTSEKTISLKPNITGQNMRLNFLLYRDGVTSTPYRETYLLVNVTASSR
jgi:uncharacterized membrane protein